MAAETIKARIAFIESEKDSHFKKLEEKINKNMLKREQIANMNFELQQQSINTVYEYECEAVNNEYENQCEKARAERIESLETDIAHYKELVHGKASKGIDKANKIRKTIRKTRSKGKPDIVERPNSGLSKCKKKNPTNGVKLTLTKDQMGKDFKTVIDAYMKRAEKRKNSKRTAVQVSVRFVRDRMLYNHLIVQDGDEVSVTTIGTKKRLRGIVTAMTNAEIILLLSNGNYERINVMDLRSGTSILVLCNDHSGDEYGY